MGPRILAQLEKVAAAGIRILPTPELPRHFVFERAGYAVLVERRDDGFGGIGSPGALSGRGFEALVDRGGALFFVWKGGERPAAPEEAESARSLLRDLRQALI